jgi:hypothetical protein
MRKQIMVSVISLAWLALATLLVFSWAKTGQAQARGQQNGAPAERGRGRGGVPGGAETDAASVPAPPGWKPCPRCQNNADRRAANEKYKVEGHPFDPHDLSGVWGFNGTGQLGTRGQGGGVGIVAMAPLTDYGKKLHDATFGEKNQYGEYLHSKDTSGQGGGAKINCDPAGWPRMHVYNYGVEFMMQRDKIVQLFQLPQTWRTIWMDGRKLPAQPPEDRWNGWSVGHWEGDTLVVESNGFDDRSWLEKSLPDGGWPHSSEMTVTERWRRLNYGTLESQITIHDPKVYTKDWVGPKSTVVLVPGAELWEDYCAPSDHNNFNENVYGPPAKGKK